MDIRIHIFRPLYLEFPNCFVCDFNSVVYERLNCSGSGEFDALTPLPVECASRVVAFG